MFLKDCRIPLSNNEAERTIRHAVVGRKNYYGSGSHTGADTAATLFTIIESCKKNDLDPRTYLTSVLKCLTESDEIETPLQHAKRIRQYRWLRRFYVLLVDSKWFKKIDFSFMPPSFTPNIIPENLIALAGRFSPDIPKPPEAQKSNGVLDRDIL